MLEKTHHQHPRLVGEGFFGAVAMMHIEVDDRDPLQPMHVQRVARRDRDVIEQAKSHRFRGPRMMTGGSNRTKCIIQLAGNDRIGRRHRGPGGAQGRAPAVGIE